MTVLKRVWRPRKLVGKKITPEERDRLVAEFLACGRTIKRLDKPENKLSATWKDTTRTGSAPCIGHVPFRRS